MMPLAVTVFLAMAAAAARPAAPVAAQAPVTITGVLVLPGEQPWGVWFEPGFSWEWARDERQGKYRLWTGGREFVPEFSDPLRPGGQVEAARQLGVTAPVHLVEIQAVPWRGPHVTIASVRVLDGTAGMPPALPSLLQGLRARFDALRRERQAGFDAAYRGAREERRAAPGGRILRELPPSDLTVWRATWLPAARLLVVHFGFKRQGAFWIRGAVRERGDVGRMSPPPERGVSYLASIGARYVVNAAGAVTGEEVFPPDTFDRTPWAVRVSELPPDEPPSPGGLELTVTPDRARIKPGERAAFTVRMTNRRDAPVWTAPGMVCTGAWDYRVRDPWGIVQRVDDRDAMGCPGGGELRTRVAPGATASVGAGWDGMLRAGPGSSRPAPPGLYRLDAYARWSEREGARNGTAPGVWTVSATATIRVD